MCEKKFQLISDFQPAGDQPEAIASMVDGIQSGLAFQTLLGVTGSGKTFSAAHVIAQLNRPTLILAHNKTLAAQLYGEMKAFFLIMLLNILCPIMIIINQKHMCRAQVFLLKKMLRLMRI